VEKKSEDELSEPETKIIEKIPIENIMTKLKEEQKLGRRSF